MEKALQRAAELAMEYLGTLAAAPISREPDVAVLRSRLGRRLEDEGVAAPQVIEELAADVEDGLLRSGNGRFHGWVIGGTLPASIAADWLTSAWDQNAAAYACSPAAAVVEEVAAGWIKDLLGLPAQASFAFVTGCQMAHVTSLAAARHHLLAERGWDVQRRGLHGAPPIRVLVGEHHETLLRALRLLGIGTDAVVRVEQREDGPLDTADLERTLARDADAPTIVSLAAGDLNRGAFDPIDEVCERAHAAGAWVHVDGAFGLWVGASARFRHLLRGVEQADSWATDAHKWLNVPHDCGLAFVAHPESHRAAMSIPMSYKVDVAGVRDQYEWGPDWSRRARGFATYAALRSLGRRGVAALVESCCDRAHELVGRLSELPGVEVLSAPIINQALVRFLDPGGNHDAWTEAVIRRIDRGGEAWFGPSTWRGKRAMRISVSSWRTSSADVERTVAAVAAALNAPG